VRVLLDEQLPRHLARDLTGHQVRTVQQEGWAGLTNGELLQRAADSAFDVFVTADQNLEFQQNLTRARLGVVVLVAPSVNGRHLLRGKRTASFAHPRVHVRSIRPGRLGPDAVAGGGPLEFAQTVASPTDVQHVTAMQ
jgi:predicted nuclease of predicted toxin-antitoxin system